MPHNPEANASRERPLCLRVLLSIIMALIEPLPAQLQVEQCQSNLRRKWPRKWSISPAGPAPLDGIDTGDPDDSKTCSFSGRGLCFASKCCSNRHGTAGGW